MDSSLTEINARWGGAMWLVAGAVDLPIFALDFALREGLDLHIAAAELETSVLTAADRHRAGARYMSIATSWDRPPLEAKLTLDGREDLDHWQLGIHIAAMPGGIHVRVVPNPATTPIGKPLAPFVVAAFGLADRQYDLGIGPMSAQATTY